MEVGIVYELLGPGGARAVFGNCDEAAQDPDYVGYLDPDNGIVGLLDGADVREQAQDLVEADGGHHGAFWLGRRSGTIQVVIDPNAEAAARNAKIAKLKQASRALRSDSYLRFTPTGDTVLWELPLRRQQRPSVSGRRPKQCQLAMASEHAYLRSATVHDEEIAPGVASGELGIPDPIPDPIQSELGVAGQLFVTNLGDAPAWPWFRIDGPITNPEILNNTTSKRIRLLYELAAGEYLMVYPKTGQILLAGVTDRYSALDFQASEWWQLEPTANDIRLFAPAFSSGANLTVYWQHSKE